MTIQPEVKPLTRIYKTLGAWARRELSDEQASGSIALACDAIMHGERNTDFFLQEVDLMRELIRTAE